MNGTLLFALPSLAFSGALMFLLPEFAPRRYFFSITVRPGFQASPEARAIERRYHWELAAALAVCAALIEWFGRNSPDFALPIALVLPLVAGFLLFLVARGQVRRYAAADSGVREAELSAADLTLPRWTLWALPPFAAPLATAAYLHQHWNRIPERFPRHWNLQGVVDGWSERTPAGVYAPLAAAAAIMLLILLTGLALFYGSRRAPQRSLVLKMLIGVMYLLAVVFTWVGLLPLIQISVLWVVVGTAIFTLGIVAWSFQLVRDPAMPAEVTPDACWHLGGFYYNPCDPAVFVQKRIGFGYTMNLGNRATWLIFGIVVGAILVLVVLGKP